MKKLAETPLFFDLTGISTSQARAPLTDAALTQAWERLSARFRSREIAFFDSVVDEELSQIRACEELAHKILARGTFQDCLFLGIGGSSLGPLSLLNALEEKCTSRLKIHVLENPDPLEWKATLQRLKPESTLVVCVTKSGTTFETLAQFLNALEWIGPERRKTHVVAITDPAKGDLRKFAQDYSIPTLAIAPAIGGRFSVFTPVGLFAAALAGLNPRTFLQGAAEVRETFTHAPDLAHPVLAIARALLDQSGDITTHVCMPYSSRLRTFADWFVQLWGESLGKDGRGFTPLAALGAVDQHSILQLLRDGPKDKSTLLMGVREVVDPVPIARAPRSPSGQSYPAFEILEGNTLHQLLRIERSAIERVFRNQARSVWTLEIERLDERNLGALYFTFCVLTAFTGTLMGVEPFDQPGVEEGKIYIRDSLKSTS